MTPTTPDFPAGARLPAAEPSTSGERGFDTGRTLRLRVEFVRQLRRRRTQVAVLILLALPIAVALAFKFGGGPSTGSSTTRGSELVDLATTGGSNFAVFLEFAATGFLLVVIVALFCGDAVASEASWSSLRYLLALPVPRARLLRQKLIVALVFSFGANVLLPAWSLAMGTAFFGGAPAVSPSGTTFTIAQSLARLGIVIVYLCGQSLVVAALGFLLSVSVDNPLGAVGGATLLVVLSNILDQITALDPYRRYLPTHFQYSWTDVLSRDIDWADMTRGTGLAFVYAAVFLAVAWLRFERKDVTS